jgi:hypothetical protein
MIIKKSSLDTMLCMVIMLSIVSPYFNANINKILVFVSMFFLLIRILLSKELFTYINTKILIITLFLPGILGAIFVTPENFIRFTGVIFLTLGFPFSKFKINYFSIFVLSFLILLYLVITQMLIMQGNQLFLDFREFAYTDEWSFLHRGPMYGSVENIFKNAFSFEANIRAGGLYSNPNVLSLLVLLYFFIFDISFKYANETFFNNKKKLIRYFFYLLILLLVVFCFLIAKSRTVVGAFSVYMIIKNIDLASLKRLKIKKNIILPALIGTSFLLFFLDRIFSAIFSQSDSGIAKLNILLTYINEVSAFNLLFGGTFNVLFDSEYGYWIGASGISGVIAFYIFFRMIYKFSNDSAPILIGFIIISFGNMLFYNLLNTPIICIILIILLSFNKKIVK